SEAFLFIDSNQCGGGSEIIILIRCADKESEEKNLSIEVGMTRNLTWEVKLVVTAGGGLA
ncbi:hypothetical protein KJ596_04390, partial [Patescibacteria group bacterium]|nr:hypothetical protein [Patescibacteria group bacterium]